MTEPERPVDALDELASAILDGEAAPAEQARAAEPGVAERLARFRRVAAVLGEPVEISDAERDAAVRAALAAASAAPVDELAARRRASARRWLPAAAAVLVVAGAIGLVAVAGDDGDNTNPVAAQAEGDNGGDASRNADDALEQSTALAEDCGACASGGATGGGSATAAPAPMVPGMHIGDFATVDELADAVAVYAPYNESFSLDEAAPTTTLATGPACQPDRDGEILLNATATVAGEPLHVFVVRTPEGDRLLAYTAAGCDERYDLAA